MLKLKSSDPTSEKIFSRISSGSSFIDVGMLVIADGLEHTSFLHQYWNNADAICTWSCTGSKIIEAQIDVSYINS